MITLALEIYFGVKAFKNGWRWRVLIPAGIAFVTVLLIGVATAANNGDVLDAFPLALVVEVGLIAVLAGMASHAPASQAPVTRTITAVTR